MDNFTAEYISKMLGTSTVEHVNVSTSVGQSVAPMGPNTSWLASGRTSHSTSTSYSSQVMSRSLLNPDEIRNLGGDLSIIMGRFQPILCRRMVYYQDWRFLHCVRPDPSFPRTEQVRWMALQRWLFDVGSVAGMLAYEGGYVVKAGRRGRWEVSGGAGTGKAGHTFANDNDLWRWAYILAMDGVDSA